MRDGTGPDRAAMGIGIGCDRIGLEVKCDSEEDMDAKAGSVLDLVRDDIGPLELCC